MTTGQLVMTSGNHLEALVSESEVAVEHARAMRGALCSHLDGGHFRQRFWLLLGFEKNFLAAEDDTPSLGPGVPSPEHALDVCHLLDLPLHLIRNCNGLLQAVSICLLYTSPSPRD